MTNYQYNAIVCFFLIHVYNYCLTFDYFSIGSYNNIVQHSYYYPDHFDFSEIKCIKSCVNQGNSKVFVGLYLTTGECRFFIYDNDNEYLNLIYYFFPDFHARDQYHGLKVKYYKEKEEYIYTSIDDN